MELLLLLLSCAPKKAAGLACLASAWVCVLVRICVCLAVYLGMLLGVYLSVRTLLLVGNELWLLLQLCALSLPLFLSHSCRSCSTAF